MKTKLLLLCASGLLVALTRASAATHYVDAASTNAAPPFSNWTTAAANIQDAVDAAAPGDEVVVTNGVYQTGARAVYGMSNRLAVTKPVTVRSMNGPEVTSIVGSGPSGPTAVRCVYLTNGAMLAGFTLTNGTTQVNDDPWISSSSTSGGGLWCESQTVVVTNCVLAGNSAFAPGGGAYSGTLKHCTLRGNSAAVEGGGAVGSALNDCTLTGNLARSYWTASATGGGAAWSTLTNCTLAGNAADTGGAAYESTLDNCTLASNGGGSGGGATSSTLINCLVTGNSVQFGGGGVLGGTLINCTLANNFAAESSGGGAMYSTLSNCIVTGNSTWAFGGGAFRCMLNNCTLTGNSAENGSGAAGSTLNNCIVYYNSNFDFDEDNYSGCSFNYSCTTPDPGSGVGNITNEPVFVDLADGNLRLQSNSPCINAGNNAYVTVATDLDGLPRIVGGTVDIGAYEFQSPASTISYAWLQQFGLSTDGSADYVDTDHDGHNNWQEWMAGTDPTNALSVLRLLPPARAGADVTLTWLSVTNRTYVLERSTNLAATPPFTTLATNLPGQPGTTTFTDTNPPTPGPWFYRVGVQP